MNFLSPTSAVGHKVVEYRMRVRLCSGQPSFSRTGREQTNQSAVADDVGRFFVLILLAMASLFTSPALAQHPTRTEHFVPIDQLDAVFEVSSGVLLPRGQYRELLEQAEASRNTASEIPAPLLIRSAVYSVKLANNHALVNVTLDLQQFADGWQHVLLPVGNLRLEEATIGDKPAVVGRDSANVLRLFHQTTERFTVNLSFSTATGRVGSNRAVGFEVIGNAPVHLTAECPARQHLLLNGRRLQRSQPDNIPATYSLPVGRNERTELRWTSSLEDSVAETLVFARSNVQVRLAPDTLRWEMQSRLSVFGGQISRLSGSVPSSLEITAVDSVGLESWELSDDPDRAGHTKLTLTWRQPFDVDRLVDIRGVAPVKDGAAGDIPPFIYNEITAHTGRLLMTHEDQLRLVATTGDGIRQLVPNGTVSDRASNPVFDYWLQDYRLTVAVQPRDRELFSQITSKLEIADTKVSFTADVSVETLNAPMFELRLETPQGWQLLSVTDPAGQSVRWRASEDSSSITVEPAEPVAAGELLKLRLSMDRPIDDPETSSQIDLPVIRASQASSVAGRYTVSSAPDLQVALSGLHGLVPTGEDSGNIVFEAQGSPISGTLTVVRKPVRLSSRSELRCWMDAHQTITTATVTIDVINGTTRTLQIRLPESAGEELRFHVAGIGQVPGYEASSMSHLVPQRIRIAEASADEPFDGFRLWNLTFDRRFAGSVTLKTRVQQPRNGNLLSAPTVEIPGAIHQEGLIAFEASADQQFDESDDHAMQGLRSADPSLVAAPPAGTGRRIARVYQFVRSAYQATLRETRYSTQVVPTAVCRMIRNISLLGNDGATQRSCRVDLHCIGVQTLRFTLPEAENAFLWSTVLNGDAVEVRRDAGDYLVAIPTGGERTDHVLDLLFESRSGTSAAFAATEHDSVRFAIDAESGDSSPIDVMEQAWQVQYPKDTFLLEHTGSFHPLDRLVRPGWLQSLAGALSMPSLAQLSSRGLIAGLILGAMSLVTVLIVRRRWVVTTAIVIVGGAVALPLLMFLVREPFDVPRFAQLGKDFLGGVGLEYDSQFDRASSSVVNAPAGERGIFLQSLNGSAVNVATEDRPSRLEADSDRKTGVSQPPEVQFLQRQLNEGSQPPDAGFVVTPSPLDELPLTSDQSRSEAGDQNVVPADSGELRRRSGSARLSVRVNMQRPVDYQTTDFRSVGAGAASSRLNIVTRTASQVGMVRFLAAALVLIACWMLRHQSPAGRIGAVTGLGLVAMALVPLAPNQWQPMLDGIVLGSLMAMILWPGAVMISWVQNCNCCRRGTTLASLLLCAIVASSAGADDGNAEPLIDEQDKQPFPDIVLPYALGESPLTAGKVFVPREQFLKLYEQAHPGDFKPDTSPPDAIVTAAFYRSGERTQVRNELWTQSFHGRFIIRNFDDTPVHVTLPFRDVAVRNATLDEKEAIVTRSRNELQVRVHGSGLHILDVVFDIPATIDASGGLVNLSLSDVPSGLLIFELPAENLNVRVNGRSDTFRADGLTVSIPVTLGENLRIEWLPGIARGSSDSIVHSVINSALEINDEGLTMVAAGTFICRQGSIAETELTLPAGYSVRSVEGKDIAGWSVEGTDDVPRLRIEFRSEVDEKTSLLLTLFSRRVISSEHQAFPVPILELPGASRSTGTVCVIAGSELDVRTESLSGVSQINPAEAVLPSLDGNPVGPVLAWRFNRHPATVVIRASRVADQLTASQLHGVQLEFERQLWTSSFDVRIQGAPRRRLDIRIPKTFLAFEVDCTDLADWYITDADNDSETFKTLSVQLRSARTGSVRVVIQGQNQQSPDRTSARFVAPFLAEAGESRTQLAIWLGPAIEIAGFQGINWPSVASSQIEGQLRLLRPAAPAISFTTQDVQPSSILLKLRIAIPSVLCESVTVTNVTSTSIERTLALSWHISRSAADTFSVELPTSVADTLDFRVPGLRQEERTLLDNDQVRITFHLQYPVSERFFVAGTGSIPLPDTSEFRSIAVVFAAGNGERSPVSIANQSHYWVIVNQSGGVLEPVRPDVDTDGIAADQLQTTIPEGFLKQSVAIRRITAQEPGSNWRARFPDSEETSPAVIALAQHVTVVADDGTWRSRHTLQVRNESRQFLPVRLPINSRPLFCLVRNKPARIVTRTSDDEVLHMIPIPQSGEAGVPFHVQFAVTGSFGRSVDSIRSSMRQEAVDLPIPSFPEYRDNNELGVTVARNTWSVYLPASWSAAADDDPRRTNVRRADTALFEDTVVFSLLDNTRSMLKQASGARHSNTKFGLFNELSTQLQVLKSQRGNSIQARQDLAETQKTIERYLGDNRVEQDRSSRLRELTDGASNTSLIERALTRNTFSNFNNDALILGNSGSGITLDESTISGKDQGSIRIRSLNTPTFNFRITDEERSAGAGQGEAQSEPTENGKLHRFGGNRKRSKLLQITPAATDASFSELVDAENGDDSGSARSEKSSASDEMSRLVFPGNVEIGTSQNGRSSAGQRQSPAVGRYVQESADLPDESRQESARPVSTGLLSLRFDIPMDGERLDFVRIGGNARLTLNVRSVESRRWLQGILWAVGCLVCMLLVLRSLSDGHVGRFVSRCALICLMVGIAGWFLLPSGVSVIGLLVAIAGTLMLCALHIRQAFRSSVDDQRRFLILGPGLASTSRSDKT